MDDLHDSAGGLQRTDMAKIITHAELDEKLTKIASEPEAFARKCQRLIRDLDARGVDLEISDPAVWRSPTAHADPSARVPLSQQFRADVDGISIQGREEEARLARRIEFARLRLARALKIKGLSEQDLAEGAPRGLHGATQPLLAGRELPPRVQRRWMELHALRVEMVERNLYLVLINVERYSHTTASQSDLIQEGCAALFRAVDGFDWRRGLLFRTYAVHWLNQAFRSYLYNFSNTVRVPVYLQKALKHVNDAKARLGDHNASVEQIAEESQLGPGLVASALAAARSSRSLDHAFDEEEEGGRLRDLLEIEEDVGPYRPEIEDISLEESLNEALGRLSERERYVVRQRFGLGQERERTLAEVADQLGVSLERVRQIQVRAINKLRTPGLRRVVEPFLMN
jgi:RNA polymerase sigma factor (sigma-70 family)